MIFFDLPAESCLKNGWLLGAQPVVEPLTSYCFRAAQGERPDALIRVAALTFACYSHPYLSTLIHHHLAGSEEGKQPLIIAIGASAGGLGPLQTLLGTIPPDSGMVFVVVMHLDPKRTSGLPDVLQTHTKLPVIQVTGETSMKQNHVYVIPPNKGLQATRHSLELVDLEKARLHRLPIDQLFRSLASTHSHRVFGIILSGSGSDGAVGMKQIKEQGGFLIVQSPEEAEFDSMPRAAIATDMVDLILPADKIAQSLLTLAQEHFAPGTPPESIAADEPRVLRMVLSHLNSKVGHDFSNYKQPTVLRRIGRRMQVNQVKTLAEYLPILLENEKETLALFRDLLIGVTTFFRDKSAWNSLAENVVPKLFQNKPTGATLRAWVAGCSSGEEAYSLGILLIEYADQLVQRPSIQIFASDIDENGLERARNGIFPEGIEADVSATRLKRFFIWENNHYRATKELRESVIFATHDLLRDPPFSRLDLITCRNLLIYLERDTQSRVFEIFHYALRPRGFLFLGSSESLSTETLFKPVDKTHRLYRSRERAGDIPRLPNLPLKVRQALRQREPQSPPKASTEERLHHYMLEHYAPPSILIDESYNIIHISETAGRFLNPPRGTLSHDLTKLVRPELRLELRSALRTAFSKSKHVVTQPVALHFNGGPVPVTMMIRHNPSRQEAEHFALVIFLEDSETPAPYRSSPLPTPNESETEARLEIEVQRLHQQLKSTNEEADVTHEELKAANEELQSMNEEYRSTTEELETSREELQSVNEELNTVNSELQSKLNEISRAHNDLQNLIAATDIGTLFLDRKLCIQRYTNHIQKLFNLMPSDVGRPIVHFSHTFDYDGLIPTAEKVLEDLRPRETEVQGKDGLWYLMRIRPYRTLEDKIEGVVLTFIDINERRRAEEALRRSEEGYRVLLENVREYAIFMMDTDRRITTWNPGAARIFGYTEEEALGQPADFIFTAEDQAAGTPQHEMEIAANDGEANDDRIHRCKDGSTFWANGILAALHDRDGKLRGYAKVLRNNTDRKLAENRLRELNESLEARVKERTKQVRLLASTLTMAEQEERRRISQILHDDLQQLLYSVQMKLSLLAKDTERAERAFLKQKAGEACASIREAIRTTRQVTVDLSPPVLKGEGLRDALQWLVSLMEEVHEMKVNLSASGKINIPDEDMRVLLFQIVRELLFNVVKHAKTKEASVSLQKEADGYLRIQVSDAGTGFDVAKTEKNQTGFGLFAVRNRLNLFGGRMEIFSRVGQGTRIDLIAPINPQKDLIE